MEDRKVTGAEYEKQYIPLGGFVLIRKDMVPEKTSGGIIIAEKTRDDHSKYTSTGVIVKLSPYKNFEEDHDYYVRKHLKEGDRVGYSGTVPLWSPSPPFYKFEGDDKEVYLTIHMRDILCAICENEEKAQEFYSRFDGEI